MEQALAIVYIVCNDLGAVREVYDTYAKAYAAIDTALRAEGLVEGTAAWEARHAQWDIVQRMVE